MYKQIVINITEHETRVALLEDGNIAELFIEREDASDIAGNIYKGRVQRVLPGMQAAFVDIGLTQAAFIYVDDVIGDSYNDIEKLFVDQDDNKEHVADINLTDPIRPYAHRNGNIEELLIEGQEIMVHVAKSPMGTKGARATTHVSLPGRFLVLMPTNDHIGVSRRIEDETERSRLKQMVQSLREDRFGYITRTAAEGVQKEKLAYEMDFLKNLWGNIQKKYENSSAPTLIHKELSVSLRAVRDLLIHEAEKLIIDSPEGYESVLGLLDTFMPSLKGSVELYEGAEPIFEAFNMSGTNFRGFQYRR